jgi:hypothetical protein
VVVILAGSYYNAGPARDYSGRGHHVTALVALNKTDLSEWIGTTPQSLMREVDQGLDDPGL